MVLIASETNSVLSCFESCIDTQSNEICCNEETSYYNQCYASCDGVEADECRFGSCSIANFPISRLSDNNCYKEVHGTNVDDLTLSIDNLYYNIDVDSEPMIMDIGYITNPIKPYIFCVNDIFYRYLPENTKLYKALVIPSDGLPSQQSVLNTYATRHGWFGTIEVAEEYANSDWGQSQGYQVMEFDTIKDLKLFQLNIHSNIQYLYESIIDDIAWYKSQNDTINTEIYDPQSIEYAILYNTELIKQKELWLDILQLTLGINVDYNKQIELLLKYGNTITNDYSYHPQDEIIKRLHGEEPNEYFWVKMNNDYNTNKYILKSYYNTTWGSDEDYLNRISFVTDIDRILCDIIATYTNTDGYIAPDMPSLFHANGRLSAEIALFKSRDAVKNA